MKKLLFPIFTLVTAICLAGNPNDEKVKYLDAKVTVGELTIFSEGAYANDAFVKTKVRFENKNDFFVVVDPSKAYFYAGGAKIYAKEKELIISPNGKKGNTFDVKGKNLNGQAMSLIIDGLKKTGNEKIVAFPEIAASAKLKESFNGCDVTILDVNYNKEFKLGMKIKVTNVGNDIVILNPGVIELKEGDNTLNNIRKRTSSWMIKKGESETVTLLFQTSSEGSEKKIIWNDALVKASLLPMEPVEIVLGTNEQVIKDYRPYLVPTPKKVEALDMDVAVNDKSRAKDKTAKKKETKPVKETKKAEVKKEEPKEEEVVLAKEEKNNKDKRAEIASEGDMVELHAADVDFSKGGKFYALLIGCSDYTDPSISDLGGLPVTDAEALAACLKKNYTFEESNVQVLKSPTRRELVIALDEMSKKVTQDDNVLIFYAGHGHYEDDNDIGYWLPKDAEVSNSANWLYNDQLVAAMRKIKSLHTLLISDACFSGSIFKNRSISLVGATDVIKKKYQLPSRKAITSGTLKTVPNKSVFIKYLLDRLEKNKDKYYSSATLFQAIETPVGNNSSSLPQFGVIANVGDEGGDFIFIRK
ncbi:MAG: caspase family protein [Bacteroidia bacterium]|nr:caspase family protein [Bacteroidia bacterium]